MDLRLKDKVAVITGASSGIGRAIAESLASEGARVIVSDLASAADAGQAVCTGIKGRGGQAQFVACDVSEEDQVEALVSATVDVFGGLDIAVNNAGIGGSLAPTGEYTVADWDRVMAVNLRGVWLCMKYELEAMSQTSGSEKQSGSIVNVSSILGLVGYAGAPAYTAAKHGVVGLTKAAALEYGEAGIRVNAVCPAFIETPMLEQAGLLDDPEARKGIEQRHALNRLGQPMEVAELVTWLSSDTASFVTGAAYLVDGGYTAS